MQQSLAGCCSSHLNNASIVFVQDTVVFAAQPTLVTIVCEIPSHKVPEEHLHNLHPKLP
jgi:hypothetical protein